MTIVIREFGHLFSASAVHPQGAPVVSDAAFEWLSETHCDSGRDDRPALFGLVRRDRQPALQARSFVGLVQTPDGTRIEVLPKTLHEGEDPSRTRRWLLRMIASLPDWRHVLLHNTSTAPIRHPLLEVFIGHFLSTVKQLVRRGLRHGYIARRDNERFLRGRLLIPEHIRANSTRRDRFFVEHDTYEIDRPANRILRSALIQVARWSAHPANQRLCRELLFVFEDVSTSRDVREDLRRCERGRTMTGYQAPLHWARLILERMTPLTTAGSTQALSLVFPMEYLFQEYVAQCLRRYLRRTGTATLHAGVRTLSLVRHCGHPWFTLEPDLAIRKAGAIRSILDTKWKRLDAAQVAEKYGIKQSDLYQLYAYGQKYLHGKGTLFLIYPCTPSFPRSLSPFEYDDHLTLWAIPFDLERGALTEDAKEILVAALNKSENHGAHGEETEPKHVPGAA